jgi:glutathione S-transferase
MVLEEKGLSYKTIEEDLSHPSETLLQLNASGQVPVLIHEGQSITESAVINEYLEERFPSPSLLSKDAHERAKMRLWTHWCASFFKQDLDLYKYETSRMSAQDQRALFIRVQSHLSKMNDALAASLFFHGSDFTLTDIHLFPFYRQMRRCPELIDFKPYSHLNEWYERIASRPSTLKVLAKPGP